jgi:hypothetical protein
LLHGGAQAQVGFGEPNPFLQPSPFRLYQQIQAAVRPQEPLACNRLVGLWFCTKAAIGMEVGPLLTRLPLHRQGQAAVAIAVGRQQGHGQFRPLTGVPAVVIPITGLVGFIPALG